MNEKELTRRLTYMIVLVRSCVDYSFMLKGELHREDKQMFNSFIQRAELFVKFFMLGRQEEEQVDDALEGTSEVFLEATRLMIQAVEKNKGEAALETLRELIGSSN